MPWSIRKTKCNIRWSLLARDSLPVNLHMAINRFVDPWEGISLQSRCLRIPHFQPTINIQEPKYISFSIIGI